MWHWFWFYTVVDDNSDLLVSHNKTTWYWQRGLRFNKFQQLVLKFVAELVVIFVFFNNRSEKRKIISKACRNWWFLEHFFNWFYFGKIIISQEMLRSIHISSIIWWWYFVHFFFSFVFLVRANDKHKSTTLRFIMRIPILMCINFIAFGICVIHDLHM